MTRDERRHTAPARWWRDQDPERRSGILGGLAVSAALGALLALPALRARAGGSLDGLTIPVVVLGALLTVSASAWATHRWACGPSGESERPLRRLFWTLVLVPAFAVLAVAVGGGLLVLGWMTATAGLAGLAAGVAYVAPLAGLVAPLAMAAVGVGVAPFAALGVALGAALTSAPR